jgi:addiction module HigA family antidote
MEERLPNIHPGEILQKDFLDPLDVTPYRLAKDIGVGRMRVSEIINGKRDITPDTAIRLGLYFGIEPEFWLNLQAHYNLVEARLASAAQYSAIPRCDRLEHAA